MNREECNNATREHIINVGKFINKIILKLINRADNHDASKLITPEVEIFTEFTPKLANSTYDSDEYKDFMKNMKIALDHHYSSNRHHPEYHKAGIKDMNLVDLIEMICDWYAATLRHKDGDIIKSIDLNQKRFGYSDELKQIFKNTIEDLNNGKV
jgi:hypothetical protein